MYARDGQVLERSLDARCDCGSGRARTMTTRLFSRINPSTWYHFQVDFFAAF
jgi:hypothetical protein